MTTQSQDTTQQISDWIQQGAREWLSGFAGSPPLSCPQNAQTDMVASDGSVRACAFREGGYFYVRVQNLSSVPVSVWGRPDLDPVKTILPQGTVALRLIYPRYGDYLSYRANAMAGLTSVVMGEVQDRLYETRMPGYKWAECGWRPDIDCLVSAIASILPKQLPWRGRQIPVRLFANGVALAYANRDLLAAFTSNAMGRITLEPAS